MALLENLVFDARFALRVLRKSPAFTLTAVVTLALGIGANVVVFGVLNAVLLRPLDIRDPGSVYQVRQKRWMTGRLITTSFPAFEDYQRRNRTFSGMAAINAYAGAPLRFRNRVIYIHGDEVTGNYFDLLGVKPALGRFFHSAQEHGPGSAPYLVLSDEFWRRAFNADRSIVGAVVELADHPFTIIGVAPAQFHGTERFVWPDYWMPMLNEEQVAGSDYLHNRTAISVTVIGRLKPGVTARQAVEDLDSISAELAREYPQTDEGLPVRLVHPGLFGDEGDVIRGFLYGVNILALLVLAAACANLANLFAARATDRSRELAVRAALGSSRRRLVGQLFTESLVISLMGGAVGLAIASLLLVMLNRWRPSFGGHLEVTADARVYIAGLVLAFGSALFGIAPARQIWVSNPLESLKSAVGSAWIHRLASRDLLLGLQIAVCTLLVTASLVAVHGLTLTLQAPLGFQPRSATLADIDLSRVGSASAKTVDAVKQLVDAAMSIPGVTAAGMVNRIPMTGGLHGIPIYAPGTTEFKMNNYILAPYVFSMSPGYLQSAGARLVGGRDLSWLDTSKTPHVAIVNETFARKMWGERRAIGQRFLLWRNLTEVVGVAQDGKYHDLTESPHPVVYVPLSQSQQDAEILVVRSQQAPKETIAALRRMLGVIQPNVPISVRSWSDELDSEFFPARAATLALGVMGLLAVMLAVTGIFGIAAYSVSRRVKELGIRAALGARKAQIVGAAVGRPVLLLAVGSALGLLSSIFATALLQRIVYQANPCDPTVIAGALLTMALLGAAATTIPVRRALAIDPSQLMREE